MVIMEEDVETVFTEGEVMETVPTEAGEVMETVHIEVVEDKDQDSPHSFTMTGTEETILRPPRSRTASETLSSRSVNRN